MHYPFVQIACKTQNLFRQVRNLITTQPTGAGCTKEVFPALHAAAHEQPQAATVERRNTEKRHKPGTCKCLSPLWHPIGFSARQPTTDAKLPTTPGLGIIILKSHVWRISRYWRRMKRRFTAKSRASRPRVSSKHAATMTNLPFSRVETINIR